MITGNINSNTQSGGITPSISTPAVKKDAVIKDEVSLGNSETQYKEVLVRRGTFKPAITGTKRKLVQSAMVAGILGAGLGVGVLVGGGLVGLLAASFTLCVGLAQYENATTTGFLSQSKMTVPKDVDLNNINR